MTRLEKRSFILGTYDNGQITIPMVCMDLHTSHTGASDPLDYDLEERYIKYLKCCLATWEKSSQCHFDFAIYQLIIATLAERDVLIRYWNNWGDKNGPIDP